MGKQVLKQKTGIDSVLVFVFAIGIMISSDTLAVLGNFFGKTGDVGFFLIIFSAIIYLTLLSQYKQLFIFSPAHSSDIEILKSVIGTTPAFVDINYCGYFTFVLRMTERSDKCRSGTKIIVKWIYRGLCT